MIRARVALVLTCTLAGLAAGCGDDDDGGGGGSDAPTKAEYIKQGDQICRAGDKAIEQEGRQKFGAGGDPSKAQLIEFTEETIVPNLEDQITQLRELAAPDGDEDTLIGIWDAADEGTASIKDDPEQVVQGDSTAFDEANGLARDYGFKVCGED